jgi:signal transduction histidine kinase
MRERLTAAFIFLAVIVLLGAGTVRAFTLRDLLREQEAGHINHDVVLIGQLVTERTQAGQPITEEYLQSVVSPDTRLTYVDPRGKKTAVKGKGYQGSETDDLKATYEGDIGRLVVSQRAKVVGDIFLRDVAALVTLFLLIALLAGAAGWLIARGLSRPFQKLAVAAGALGRGRFDLELPNTHIPEARAISESLQTSALQLRARMARERAFAEHASHELRTPLTALRLELEDLTLRDDVPEDAKAAAARCMISVDEVNTSAGELVALARRGSLVEGAEVTLHELATQVAQRWADRHAEQRRTLSASAEGDLEMAFTPGPVEHILDLVLSDIVLSGKGPVKITFFAQDDYLKVRMPAGVIHAGKGRRRGVEPGAGLAEAREVAESQGGRVSGDGTAEDLEILLPRR